MRQSIQRTIDQVPQSNIPDEVSKACAIDWGVMVDAYLASAAPVGSCYAAKVFLDQSGMIYDGMTVVTPAVEIVIERSGFLLAQSVSGQDHYVIVSLYNSDQE